MFNRIASLFYGLACYVVFLFTFLYAIAFVGNIGIAKSIDSAPQSSFGHALAVDVALLGLFAVQHSVMAREWFKRAWTRLVPRPVERATYVLFSSLAMLLLFWKWEPMGGIVWDIQGWPGRMAMAALFSFGWLTVLATTFLINHFDLFGLRQVWLHFREEPYQPLGFRTPGLYKYVRHPLYVGWFFFFWFSPVMSAAHLLLAVGTTAYIFVAIQLEERDLMRMHGEYREYRSRVPMVIPNAIRREPSQESCGRAATAAKV